MTKTVFTIILIALSHLIFAGIPINKLAKESDLILKGKVIDTHFISSSSIYNSIAVIKIERLFKGKWNDSIIKVPFCGPGLHSYETYYLNEEIVGFFNTKPTVMTVMGNQGKISLKGSLKDSFSTFLGEYLTKKSKNEKINFILDYISIGPDYSFLSSDLVFVKKKFHKEQQSRILRIVLESDSMLSKSRFTQSKNPYERQPYRILDYYRLLLRLNDSQLKIEAIEYLGKKLERETSNYLAFRTMGSICHLTNYRKECVNILNQYNVELHKMDGTDTINKPSQILINQLLEEIKK